MTRWMRAFSGLSGALWLAGCGGEDAETPAKPHAKELAAIRAELEGLAQSEHLPGLAYAVVVDGKMVDSGGIGVRSTKTGEPLTADMVMPTGSIAVKTLVAAATMRLHQEGKLSLDAPVKSVLPWLTLPAGSEAVTFQQGFTMVTGLGTPLRVECADPSLKAVLADQKAFAPPGHLWVYSSTGFTFAALAIEELEKTSFESVLQKNFLDPVGMTTATFDASVAMQGEHSSVHLLDEGEATAFELDSLPQCKPGVDCSVCEEFRANAGLYLSANHLGRMVEHLVAKAAPFDAGVLDAMGERADDNVGAGVGYNYGYGAFSYDFGGKRVFFGGTQYAGVSGVMGWVPETGVGAVVVVNAMPAEGKAFPIIETHVVQTMRHFIDLPEPDFSTPTSTWGKYVGKYSGLIAAAPYEVTLSGDELRISNSLWSPPDPVVMKQGGYWSYSGGDSFHYFDPMLDAVRHVTFFAGDGDGTQMQYMLSEDPWMVGKRMTE